MAFRIMARLFGAAIKINWEMSFGHMTRNMALLIALNITREKEKRHQHFKLYLFQTNELIADLH